MDTHECLGLYCVISSFPKTVCLMSSQGRVLIQIFTKLWWLSSQNHAEQSDAMGGGEGVTKFLTSYKLLTWRKQYKPERLWQGLSHVCLMLCQLSYTFNKLYLQLSAVYICACFSQLCIFGQFMGPDKQLCLHQSPRSQSLMSHLAFLQ